MYKYYNIIYYIVSLLIIIVNRLTINIYKYTIYIIIYSTLSTHFYQYDIKSENKKLENYTEPHFRWKISRWNFIVIEPYIGYQQLIAQKHNRVKNILLETSCMYKINT